MNVCLILGAGASLANAVHFRGKRMQHTHPPLDATFFQTVQDRGVQLTPGLRRYLTDVIGIDPGSDRLRSVRMEELFKDVFFDFQENPTDRPTYEAYVGLVELYLRVLRDTTNWLCEDGRRGAPIGRLLAAAARVSSDLNVVTFNHDLVIENEIFRRVALRNRWCIDSGYGAVGDSFDLLYPVAGASIFHVHSDGLCDHARSIRVLKLHGSLNWVVRLSGKRPKASLLSGRGGSPSVHLLVKRAIGQREVVVRSGRGRSRWETWPVVVPPVYAKHGLFPGAIQRVRDDARAAVKQADRVIFFGYSLPRIDVEAEKLFERALAKNRQVEWLDVIDPSPAAAERYAGLSPALPVRWYPSLQKFSGADTLS